MRFVLKWKPSFHSRSLRTALSIRVRVYLTSLPERDLFKGHKPVPICDKWNVTYTNIHSLSLETYVGFWNVFTISIRDRVYPYHYEWIPIFSSSQKMVYRLNDTNQLTAHTNQHLIKLILDQRNILWTRSRDWLILRDENHIQPQQQPQTVFINAHHTCSSRALSQTSPPTTTSWVNGPEFWLRLRVEQPLAARCVEVRRTRCNVAATTSPDCLAGE